MTIKYSRHLPHVSSLGPALLTLWSLLTTVPQFIGRVGWIRRLILSMPHISVEFSESDIDREAELPPSGIDEAQQRVTRIIAPRAVCGACGGFRGNFVPVNNEPTMSKYRVTLYTEDGVSSAEAFNFECTKCGVLSGVVGYTKFDGQKNSIFVRYISLTASNFPPRAQQNNPSHIHLSFSLFPPP